MGLEKIGVQLEAQGASEFSAAFKSVVSSLADFSASVSGASANFSSFKSGTDTAKSGLVGLGTEATTAKTKLGDIGQSSSSVWPAVKTGADGAKTSVTGLGAEAGNTKTKVSDIGKAGSDITTVKNGSDTAKSSLTGLGTEAGTTKGKVSDIGKSGSDIGTIKSGSDGAKGSLTGLGNEATNTKAKVSSIGKEGSAWPAIKTGSTESKSSLNSLGTEAEKTKGKLKDLDDSSKGSFLSGIKERATEVKDKLVEFGGEAATELVKVGVESVQLAGNYEASMNRVKFLTGATADQMKEYSKAAIDIGMTTTFSSGKAADGLANLAQMGYKGKDAIDLLSVSANAAMTNNTGLGEATNQVATVLKAMNLPTSQASHALDVMTKASQLGKLSFTDFQDVMSRVGGVAQSSGQSFEEVTSAILSMTNTGMSAQQASNQLKGALVGLEKPNTVAAREIKTLGLSISDSEGKMRPFSDIIAQLQEKTAGLTQEQKNLALANIFGKGNITGITDAMNAQAEGTAKGSASLKDWTNSLKNSDGTAASAAKTIMSGFNAAVANLKGSFEEAQIAVGSALLPALTGIVKEVTGIVNSFIEWENETHTVGGFLSALAGVAINAFHVIEGGVQIAAVALKPFVDGLSAVPGVLNSVNQAANGTNADLGTTASQFAFLAQNITKLDSMAAIKTLQETGAEFVQIGNKIYDATGKVQAFIGSGESAAQAVDRLRESNSRFGGELNGLVGAVMSNKAAVEAGTAAHLNNAQATESHRQKLLGLENAVEASEKGFTGQTQAIADAIPVTSNYVSGLDTFHNSAVNDKIALDDATAAVNNFSSALNASQKDLSEANTLMNNLKDAAVAQTPEVQKAWNEFQTYAVKSAAGGAGAEEARAKMASLRSELETAHNPKLLAAADAFDKEAQKAALAKSAIIDNTVSVVDASDKQEKLKAKVVDADQSLATLTKTLNSHAESTRTMTAVSNSGAGALNGVAGSASTARTNLDGATTANQAYNAVPLPGKSVEVDGAQTAINAYQAMRQALLAYNQTPVSPKNVPTPQSYAKGTSYHPGGMALVGEAPAGPELIKYPSGKVAFVTQPTLMNLPRGTQVFNPAQTAQMMARPYSTSTNINTSSQSSSVTNAPSFNLNMSGSMMESQGVVQDFNMMRIMAGV